MLIFVYFTVKCSYKPLNKLREHFYTDLDKFVGTPLQKKTKRNFHKRLLRGAVAQFLEWVVKSL